MKRSTKFSIFFIFALALSFPFTGWLQNASIDFPTRSYAMSATSNPVGTNIITEVAKEKNPAVVSVRSIKKIKRMRSQAPFNGQHPFNRNQPGNPFGKMFPTPPQPPQKGNGMGSGFIISEDGLVITNHHVVDGADEIKVLLLNGKSTEEKEYSARLIGSDAKTDLAILQINQDPKNTQTFPYMKFGNSESLEVGEWVIAIGNPFGLSHTVTAGIVSAKGRNIGSGPYDEFIQTDASINPGNSGGPLLNLKGEVIGINTAIISGNSGGNVGIGFAIPINMASTIIDQLKKDGKVIRGWLGVMIQKLTPELAANFGVQGEEGALVSDVLPNGPAHKGGLLRGDVVVAYNNEKVNSFSDLPKLVAKTSPGKTVEMEVIRNGSKQSVSITIEELTERNV